MLESDAMDDVRLPLSGNATRGQAVNGIKDFRGSFAK
jgi:hypothetical protein